jgi:hypothetical protein
LNSQRLAGIEPDAWFSNDQRIVGKAGVGVRIWNHECFVLEDRVSTERDLPVCLGDILANARFEPLPIGVDQAD